MDRLWSPTALVLAMVSCGGSEGAPDDTGASSEAVECEPPGFESSPEPVAFTHLDARVVDSSGNGVPDLRAQACGINLCINATTEIDGTVSIDNEAEFTKPAFKYGLGRTYVKFALPLSADGSHSLGDQGTVLLPDVDTSSPFDPGSDVTSGGITLSLPANLNDVEIDPFDFDTDELKGFRGTMVPIDLAPPAVDPSLGLELLYGMTPVGAVLCPAATMTVENSPGWDAGTSVEFFLHGVEVQEEWAPYAGWAKVSEGHVSEDGTTISTDEGGGIPLLGVIGIRRSP